MVTITDQQYVSGLKAKFCITLFGSRNFVGLSLLLSFCILATERTNGTLFSTFELETVHLLTAGIQKSTIKRHHPNSSLFA